MDVHFADGDLARLETERAFNAGHARAVVRAFRKVLAVLRAAVDERDLYGLKSLHFEKLKGKRAHQRSLRLNAQWRLLVEIVPAQPKNAIRVVKIEDYH